LRLAGGTIASGLLAGTVGRGLWAGAGTAGDSTPITVYASPSCGCCHEWISYLGANGFGVETHNVDDVTAIKRERHVPDSLWSCHTAVVDGYLVEGHVPADLVRKMLAERPPIAGLAVPGMPSSAPGMDGAPAPYTVLAFTSNGDSSVYAER
jgi:hypothetical protein